MPKQPLIYLAQPMGARLWKDVVSEAIDAKRIVEENGFRAWSPSLKEIATSEPKGIVGTTFFALKSYWREDLEAIRKCDAVISLRGDLASEGVGMEIGLARYKYKIPVVIVAPKKMGRITHLEANAIVPTVTAACKYLKKNL